VTGAEPGTATPRPAGGRTLRGRALLAATRVLAALPNRPLVAAAESLGEIWYRMAPERAAQARANLRRVCEGLAAQGRGTTLARRAATDPQALELLVRRCFRHAVRYYLEVAQTGSVDPATALERIDVDTPEEVSVGLRSGEPMVVVGMHFGALEMPISIVINLSGRRMTSPMETMDDPAMRTWFETSRGRMGVDVIPLKNARRALLAALKRGDSIGLVNDRDLTGTGMPIPLFGHPAPISPAPAVFALEAGARVYVASSRRIAGGRYTGKLQRVPVPTEGSRRERIIQLTTNIAEAYETVLAEAPEQWWGAFHPIWPDLVVAAEPAAAAPDEKPAEKPEAPDEGSAA
jgi:KDO2-lipid IV(A) lauroyltransferase